jgi:hypothetical protein
VLEGANVLYQPLAARAERRRLRPAAGAGQRQAPLEAGTAAARSG